MTTLVGDRFARMAGGWVDLVTGRVVDMRVGRAPTDLDARRTRCEAMHGVLVHSGPQLVDFGEMGRDGWFEATQASRVDDHPPRFGLRRIERSLTTAICTIAADPALRGIRHIAFHAPPRSGAHVAVQDVARALRRLGFVTIRADLSLPSDLQRQLRHRHVALLVMSSPGASAAVAWAADLARVGNRGHLVIERIDEGIDNRDDHSDETSDAGQTPQIESAPGHLRLTPCDQRDLVAGFIDASAGWPLETVWMAALASRGWPGRFVDAVARGGVASTACIARDSASPVATVESGSTWPFSVSLKRPMTEGRDSRRLLSRADGCVMRGRRRSGDSWLVAALEASRRRGDARDVVRTLEEWVPKLIAQGRWQRAADVATTALTDAIDPGMRSVVARLAASAHLEGADLSRADTCIDTAICIEQLTHGRATDASLAMRAAIRLWQGRWVEGRAELEALTPDQLTLPQIAVWRELLAWAHDDDRRLRWMPAEAVGLWPCATRIFRAAASGISAQLQRAIMSQASLLGSWGHVVAAQAWLDIGDHERAVEQIAAFVLRPLARRGLVDVVGASIRRSVSRLNPDDAHWLDAVVARERIRGIARWGQERADMQMLHDISTLLEIVQASDDDALGLRQVCDWCREAAGATSCAIVAAPSGDVVAGDIAGGGHLDRALLQSWLDRPQAALDESDASAEARAPIRYGGVVVGFVVGVSAPARARPALNAVQAAAAVSGAMLRAQLDSISTAARNDTLVRDILGVSPVIQAVRTATARAALAPFPVVVEGESGTGKELVARALHGLGPRRDRVFAALNCAALTDELVEAELFGHARGAFTHAVNARAGLFEEAHQGTLFLDEVGELSPRAQAKLLRVLQEGEIRRVGENESRAVDVRVVAATNRPLPALAAAGRFREDLMFRLSVIRIQVPPLRDRAADIPQLALAFWRQAAKRVGTRAQLGPDALSLLASMLWPGNVRELQNAMAALAVAAPATGRVSARLVRIVLHGISGSGVSDAEAEIVPLDAARRDVERRLVSAALSKHTGSRIAAAHALGLSRQGLSKAMRRLGLAEAGVA